MIVLELLLGPQRQLAADAPAQVAYDLPVGAAFAYRLHGLSDPLHTAFAVGKRSILFRECRGGQHHVRDLRRLVQKDILHHQELQVLEGLFRVMEVRLA